MTMQPFDDRLNAIETRLTHIEQSLYIQTQRRKPAPSVSTATNPWTPAQRSTLAAPRQKEKPGNWLGIIAMICFVFAAGLIIKLTVDSGWLTPDRQIGLAILLGIALIGSGFALMRTDRAYASLLPGAGVVILYLAVFAAHSYYNLIPFGLALGATILISTTCIWLYIKIRHDVYPITASVGAYLAPLILNLNAEPIFSLNYFVICSVAFALISIGVKSRALTLVSAYLAIIQTAWVGFHLGQDLYIAGLLAAHFLIFSTATYLYSTRNNTVLTETESLCFFPVLWVFYVMEYYFIAKVWPGRAPWISLGFAALLLGWYLVAKRYLEQALNSRAVVWAFVAIVCFHAIYIEILPDGVRPWLFVVIAIMAACAGGRPTSRVTDKALVIPSVAVGAIVVIEYLRMVQNLLDDTGSAGVGVSLVALLSLWGVIVTSITSTRYTSFGYLLLGAAHVLAIVGFYRLTEDTGSLAVSASWLLYGAAVIGFACARQDEIMAKSALLVLGFAAAKALLYDAASAPTLVRILCLLLTGVMLYGCGLLLRKFDQWTAQKR